MTTSGIEYTRRDHKTIVWSEKFHLHIIMGYIGSCYRRLYLAVCQGLSREVRTYAGTCQLDECRIMRPVARDRVHLKARCGHVGGRACVRVGARVGRSGWACGGARACVRAHARTPTRPPTRTHVHPPTRTPTHRPACLHARTHARACLHADSLHACMLRACVWVRACVRARARAHTPTHPPSCPKARKSHS